MPWCRPGEEKNRSEYPTGKNQGYRGVMKTPGKGAVSLLASGKVIREKGGIFSQGERYRSLTGMKGGERGPFREMKVAEKKRGGNQDGISKD